MEIKPVAQPFKYDLQGLTHQEILTIKYALFAQKRLGDLKNGRLVQVTTEDLYNKIHEIVS